MSSSTASSARWPWRASISSRRTTSPRGVRDFAPSRDVLVASDEPDSLVPLEVVERRYVLRVLDAVGGRRGQAARILGLDRKTLYRKLERWGHVTDGPDE